MSFSKRTSELQYDASTHEPVVKKSICNREMSVGLVDKRTGKFQELMRVNGQQELKAFCKIIGVKEIKTIY